MRYFALILLVPLALAAQPASPGLQQAPPPLPPTPAADLASMEGQIVDAIAGTPLRKATVTINRNGGGRVPSGGRTSYSGTSDATGHYSITGIEPGTYRVNVTHTGYLNMQYNARRPQGTGTPLDLGRGQKVTGVSFKLTPHGVITGKITDDDGDPLENVNLQLMRWVYNNGAKQLQNIGGASTNDLGVYRMSGILPGTYLLSALRRNLNVSAGAGQEDYVLSYFSGATDLASAAPIEVAPGAQLDGINMRLSKVQTVRVRGHVVDNAAPPPAPARPMPTADGQIVNAVGNPRVIVRLMPGDGQQQMNGNMTSTAVQPNGTFEFASVAPGSYTLVASTNGPNPHSSHRLVEVSHTNVDDVNLSIDPGASVAGRVRYDGDPPQPLPSLTVRLVPKNTAIGMGQPQPAKVDPDGSFHFDNVNPELYTVNINTPQNLYLKSVRSGATDVLISGLDLTNGAGSLDILLGVNPPQVSGTVTNAETGQPAVAVAVLLAPQEKERLNQILFYSYANTDQNGNFTFNRVMPGEYKAYAWEDVEFGKWFDPDFMKAYESKGEAVSAKENSPVTLKLNMIPAK